MHDLLSKPAENANVPKPRFDNFAFLMNVSKLVGAESFLLAPGHELRRATPEETTIIKRLLLHHGGGMLGGFSYPFEYEIGPNWQMTPIAEEEWRYFVIGFRGSPTTAAQLENAFCLADMEFRIPFTVLRERASELTEITEWMYNGRLPQMLEEARWQYGNTTFREVSATEIGYAALLLRQLQEYDNSLVQMSRISRQLLDLEALPLPPISESRFLGYFGILESLLTHRPHPTDPYDSITRQVKKKLTLLDHRWSIPLDYSAFGEIKPDAVWSKMYAYRSDLAHGDTADFSGELKILGDANKALALLRSTVKAVARQALSEPRLIADLRDC